MGIQRPLALEFLGCMEAAAAATLPSGTGRRVSHDSVFSGKDSYVNSGGAELLRV
jgi:hypothetical protein